MKLFRPVKGERNVDRRLTQGWMNDFKDPKTGKRMYKEIVGRPGHLGLDYAGPRAGMKIPIYSCSEGTVTKIGWDDSGFGNRIVVKIGDYEIYYAHMDSFSPGLKVGSTIQPKQQLGIMGTSGNSTAVHLHLGIRSNEEGNKLGWIDPTPMIVSRDVSIDDRPEEVLYAISKGYYNGVPGDGLTDRVVVSMIKSIRGEIK